MENFLLKLLNMSLTGSYVILAMLILRLLLRGAPRWVSYALWAVPFLRLALPFSFESAFSLVRVKPNAIPADIVYAAQPAIDSGVRPLDTVVNTALTAVAPDVTAGNSVNPLQVILFICFWLWLAGVVAFAVFSLFQTLRLHRYLRCARHIEGNRYEIGRADTPFVFGLFRPRIYLPSGLGETESDYILAHERHHIKRCDHLLRPIAFCITVAHWFNPFVWLAYWLLGVDMEQSCDEAVLRRFGADIRKAYSSSLVGLASAPRALHTGPLGFAENDIARRVKRILHWKRPTVWFTVLAACAAVVVGCGLMSDPPINAIEIIPFDEAYSNEKNTAVETEADVWAFSHMERIEMILDDYFEIAHRGYGLEELGTVDTLLDTPVTFYRCEVFYVPADYEAAYEALGKTAIEANFVKNGNQYEIRDIPKMSRIYFAFSEEKSFSFGASYDQYFDDYPNESIYNLELLARAWLETNQEIITETFPNSAHYVVTYEEYHPGVMKKLLLSQPAKQGEGGIWFVERMMDENGYEHISAAQNYTALQKDCNDGHNPWMLDPEQVALEFIRCAYDSARIIEIEEGTYEDFLEYPVSTYTGFIIGIDPEAHHLKLMPTVYDENGEPTLWAKGYSEYYDYLPYSDNVIIGIDGYEKTPQMVEQYLKDNGNSLYAKCTYYGGQIKAIKAFTYY